MSIATKRELGGISEYATEASDKKVADKILEYLGQGVSLDDIFFITDEKWSKDTQVTTLEEATNLCNWPVGNGGYDRLPVPEDDFESAEEWVQEKFEEYCEACGCCGVVVESGKGLIEYSCGDGYSRCEECKEKFAVI